MPIPCFNSSKGLVTLSKGTINLSSRNQAKMNHAPSLPESFEEFKNSFAYGSRTDLNFKFLKALSNEEAAQFFQDLLWKLGDSFDDGQFDRLVEHVRQGQIHVMLRARQAIGFC